MCFGPLKRFCHWGPLTAFGIIKLVSFMVIYCCTMILPPTRSFGGFLNMLIFLMFSSLTVYNFLSAVFEGPGYLPLRWVPENPNNEIYLQFCNVCEGFKAPRSHHCRKCGRCVLKMDHHCPWINNCVGHANHAHFALFLFFSVLGCLQSSCIFSFVLYQASNRMKVIGQEYQVYFTLATLILCVLALSLSIGVVIAIGLLLYLQLKSILHNRTGIEDWIVEKANSRRLPKDPVFIFPYNLGWKKNFLQVFNCGSGPTGDGITWAIVDGCDQFTLTIEQKEQKYEKRARTRCYKVVKKYSGRWFPLVHGCAVLCHPPLTDESRISLSPGTTVRVTRWRRYWLFGELDQEDNSAVNRVRGWFPRRCVEEIEDINQPDEEKKNQ